jgi:hypothetical protein
MTTTRTIVDIEPPQATAGRGYVFREGDQFGVRFNQRDCTPRWNDQGPARAYLDALTRGTRKPEYGPSGLTPGGSCRVQQRTPVCDPDDFPSDDIVRRIMGWDEYTTVGPESRRLARGVAEALRAQSDHDRLVAALRKIEQIAAPVHEDSDAARALRQCYLIAIGELAALAAQQGVAMAPARTPK